MSHLCSEFSPLRRAVSVGKLNQVQTVLDIGVECLLRSRSMRFLSLPVLILTGHSHIHYRQRFCTQFLTQQEQLIKTHSVTLEIIRKAAVRETVHPAVLVYLSIFHGTHGMFPLVAVIQGCALHNASARKAEHTGAHVVKRLHDVLAQAVPVASPGINREKADVLHITHLASPCAPFFVGKKNAQLRLLHFARTADNGLVLFPFRAVHHHLHFGQLLMLCHGGGLYELNLQHLRLSLRHSCPDRETVVGTGAQSHTKETLVLQASPHF